MKRRTILGAAVLAAAAVALAAVMATHGTTADASTMPTAGDPVGVVEYNLGDKAFTDKPDWGGVSELRAVVHYPKKLTGKLPVVVLLHGQQVACYSAAEDDWAWPCPPGVKPYPSNRGYDYLARSLSRDGFVVVSPAANGINYHVGTAPERAHLINRHLAMLQQLTTTGGGPLAGRFTDPATGRPADVDFRNHLDLTRVGTMGHSVGGQGVFYQAADAHRAELPAGVRIRGVVAVASPYFNLFDMTVTKAQVAVLSAGCFGTRDEAFYRDAESHHGVGGFLVKMPTANHNYFNTAWTKGPGPTDGDDTTCPETTGRPTAEQQKNLAVTYLTAFFRYALNDDKRGLPVLTGKTPISGVTNEIESFHRSGVFEK
ncbi:hypothetical protein [Actinoplanes palleronii]|uniref:Alpha/beta hydrolase n=1 Tax=Actinoplanes palleronii TaxID=113570 RepID=A0ABQ4BNJ6_9ACTN|nr:hypothetical protein [Actinoplanes palleronii]GIE72249.1 hypothetical protein Apa02nite_083570 [Actinoplanes palleronii]